MGDQHCYECRWWQLSVPNTRMDDCVGKCYAPLPLSFAVHKTEPQEIGAMCIGCKVWTPREDISL